MSEVYLFVGGSLDGALLEQPDETNVVRIPFLVGDSSDTFDPDAELTMFYETYHRCGYELDDTDGEAIIVFALEKFFGIKRKQFKKLLDAAIWKMFTSTARKIQ